MEGALNEEGQERMRFIVSESTRVQDMAHEILDFAQGKVSLDKKTVTLSSYLREVEQFVTPYLDGLVTWIWRSEYPGKVELDTDKFRRVFYNLAVIKFLKAPSHLSLYQGYAPTPSSAAPTRDTTSGKGDERKSNCPL